MRAPLLLLVALVLAGCSASGATAANFQLTPARVGWFAGDEAQFTLTLTPTLLQKSPTFTIDRRFAIEEVRFDERGANVGGDHATRDPDSIALRLARDGEVRDEWVLDEENASVDLLLLLPPALRDSEYALELRVFEVGWVKSEPFRVDRR